MLFILKFVTKVKIKLCDIILFPFIMRNPEYCFQFSDKSNKRLNDYISNCNVRIKRIAAEAMLNNLDNFHITIKKYKLSQAEVNLLLELINPIKKELKIL